MATALALAGSVAAGCSTADPTDPVASPVGSSPTDRSGATPSIAADSGDADGSTATVVAVIDGDTLDVATPDGTARVRLIGVNAPERGECFASQATAWLTRRVEGRTITLVRDASDVDRHDRLLRYVELAGTDVNEELVATGHAIARRYPPDVARADAYDRAQAAAQAQGAGMWAADGGCRAPDAEELGLVLSVNPDAPGDDSVNLNGEWVDVRNAGDTPVDLAGWTLKDESASHRYAFAGPARIEPGEVLRLRSGCGQDTRLERFWCAQGSAIWNNDGDTATLLDADGRIVVSASY